MSRDDKLNEQNRDGNETDKPNETAKPQNETGEPIETDTPNKTDTPNETDETKTDEKREVKETKKPYTTAVNETGEPIETDKPNETGETTEKRETKKPYTTAVNDPDLLVTYEPIKGAPPTIKCPNCGEEMPTTIDTCVNCGHYLKKDEKHYVPMDEKKMKKIRWTIGVICIIAFVLFMIFSGKFLSN